MKSIYSAGARYERKAFRALLRRRIAKALKVAPSAADPIKGVLDWVLKRMQRYSKRPKGL